MFVHHGICTIKFLKKFVCSEKMADHSMHAPQFNNFISEPFLEIKKEKSINRIKTAIKCYQFTVINRILTKCKSN